MAAEGNFVDQVKIVCRSGRGGNGSAHFRREKYIPKGGPDGGDGGDGGDIVLRANRNYHTLIHLRYNRHVFAPDGASGSGALKTGASGQRVVIEVPVGTTVHDAQTGEFLMEVTAHNEEKLLLKGGKGGKGNTHFKSATNQAPRFAQPGGKAEERELLLQIKTLADVGLVGKPNAGKSTLLSVVSAAKPKIADYPFTTLVPSVGIVDARNGHSFVMADIPGIIEGAAQGRGLGLRFLRHIERNSLLLFVIPIDTEHIGDEFRLLHDELVQYNPGMAQKRAILAISKCDLADNELMRLVESELPSELPHCFISSVTWFGIDQLKDLLWNELQRELPYDNTEMVHRDLPFENLPTEESNEQSTPPDEEEDELMDIAWDEDILKDMGLDE